ncbi:hypothetical protein ACT80S_18170 [Ramlibacter sp. MAHUQ-53]|uniref:hypothetical protein n=1 Tax=unclassified Ramlibacter TaxID=2617605 RepID=UPI003641CCBE
MEATVLLFVAYFALLAWAMRRGHRVVRGRWLFFLRAFFPNWKFYHAVGRPPRLHVRGQDAQGTWLPWQRVYPRRARRWLHLLHNPDVNLALSHQNLVDHLASDVNELPEGAQPGDLVSYRLVYRLAREALPPQAAAFQFEIRLESPRGEPPHCLLQSPVMPVQPPHSALAAAPA